MSRTIWILCFCLSLVSMPLCALGGRDNQGTEFIIAFMENKNTANDLELFVTTSDNNGADVVVTAPLYDASLIRTASISRGGIKKITLPNGLRGVGVEKGSKGIHVNATAEVTVYGINKEVYSTDGFVAFPTDTLGNKYYAMTWETVPELMVVATEDSTSVTLVFPSPSTPVSFSYGGSSYGNGDTLTITLNRWRSSHRTTAEEAASMQEQHGNRQPCVRQTMTPS